jgi:MipA family protein
MSSLPLPPLSFASFKARPVAVSVLAIALSAFAVTAVAQQPPDPGNPEDSSWGLGIGVTSGQEAYFDIKRKTKVLPVLQFENKYVRIFGLGGEIKLPSLELTSSQRMNFGIVGQYDGSGYEAGDAPILAGMAERKGVFWAGARATWKNDVADLSAERVSDVSGNSKGKRVTLGLEKTWRTGANMMVTPRVAGTWYDKKYVDYYYGVRINEARAGRRAFRGEASVNVQIEVRAMYIFDNSHSLIFDVSATSLGKGIKNSPLVNKTSENRVAVGYLYRF